MTARKHFKALVRDRMRRTGERYTVARRHVQAAAIPEADGWELRGGLDGETAAFADVLANLGVEHDGRPLSEAMILGVGGGLGAGYILTGSAIAGCRTTATGSAARRSWSMGARAAST